MWKISTPMRSASLKLPAPAGTIMNSWMSRPLSAWTPPLSTFISGTGRIRAPGPAEVLVERQARLVGRGARRGERDAEQRVGAESRLVGRAVQLEERAVDQRLLGRVQALDLGRDHLDHVLDGALDPLAEVAVLLVVAELDGLARPRRGARGHERAPIGARLEPGLDLDGGVAARVEHLAGVQGPDLRHGQAFRSTMKRPSARIGSARGPSSASASSASAMR